MKGKLALCAILASGALGLTSCNNYSHHAAQQVEKREQNIDTDNLTKALKNGKNIALWGQKKDDNLCVYRGLIDDKECEVTYRTFRPNVIGPFGKKFREAETVSVKTLDYSVEFTQYSGLTPYTAGYRPMWRFETKGDEKSLESAKELLDRAMEKEEIVRNRVIEKEIGITRTTFKTIKMPGKPDKVDIYGWFY